MPNLRIVGDNCADRGELVASSQVSTTLGVNNLLTDVKNAVWRSTGTSATVTVTWSSNETMQMVALPWCNLTGTATIRARLYTNTSDVVGVASPVADTGTVTAVRKVQASVRGLPLGVNSFAYGGGQYAVAWFGLPSLGRKLVVDLVDTSNAAGYLEAARLVAGAYWEAAINPQVGASVEFIELSRHERTDAGSLVTERGARARKITMDLAKMPATDRDALWDIVRGNGMGVSLFASMMPASSDTGAEALWQVYGRFGSSIPVAFAEWNAFAAQLVIEEA